ncbi:SPOR domain-containing protein [Persephonella sp.]
MFSDIYGQDKKEKYLIIYNLLKDGNVFGILYGKKGIGKKFIVNKAVRSVSADGDRIIFLEAGEDIYSLILKEIGIYRQEIYSKEDFLIYFIDFLEKFQNRVFIVINNVHQFTEKELSEIFHLLGLKEKVSTILIGDETLKEKLSPFKLGKMEAGVNFIFEVKPPEFEEFKRYFDEKYGGKIDNKALKKLYYFSAGSFSKAEEIIIGLGKFPVKASDLKTKNKNLPALITIFLLTVVITTTVFYLFFKPEEKKKEIKKITVVDKKLPEEGSIINELPVKPRKKNEFNVEKIIDRISKQLSDIQIQEIPPLSFYKKPVKYVIQIASFRNEKYAQQLKEKLSEKFPVDVIVRKNGIRSVVIFASDKKEVDNIISRLKETGFKPLVKKVK